MIATPEGEPRTLLSEVSSCTATMKGEYGFCKDALWQHTSVYEAAIEEAEKKFDTFGVRNFEMQWVQEGEDSGYVWTLEVVVED